MFLGNSKRDIQSLKERTDEAIKGNEFHPIEIEDDGTMGDLGKNFNSLGLRLNAAIAKINDLSRISEQNQELSDKLVEYQSSIDQLSIIGELGQKVTSTLSIQEMFQKLSEIINSMMDASVILLGVVDRKKKLKFYRSPEFPVSASEIPTVSETTVAEWSLSNKIDVFLDDAEKDYSRYFFDPIISLDLTPAKSVICYPMTRNEQNIGVLCIFSYRKNAYNDYHLSMVRSLMTYVGVAIENSSVYEELKATQSQLVQSEKMASLGQLTAGIAHEINNPINFVSAGIESLKSNYQEIKSLLGEYMDLKPGEDNNEKLVKIEKHKKDIEIEILLHEIEELYGSIKNGASRTTEIVKNLRNFTRLDENEFKLSNLEEGLDSTLVILNSQLKDRIEVIKEYGHLPLVNCFPGQINQVFINILNNAAQAIEGPGKIWIKTLVENGQAEIIIKDSGMGMSEETKNKIFDPFFTTKDVGIGTGLGLSISYGIIEKHHGTISVESVPGEGTQFTIKIPLNLN